MVKFQGRVALFGLVLCTLLAATTLSAQDELVTQEQLKANGVFGLSPKDATVVHDSDDLLLLFWNDDAQFVVQAILWKDNDDTLGETSDGRPMGDCSNLVLDVAGDGKRTPITDRTYSLNPWPQMPGLHYTYTHGRGAWSHIKRDSEGRGAIRYLPLADGGRVRVDTYVIPLAELEAEAGRTIKLAFMASSTVPEYQVNSVGYNGGGKRYYSMYLPFKSFQEAAMKADGGSLDVTQVPRGRDDKKRAVKPKAKPLLKAGATTPELVAEDWIGVDEPPTLESLKGKVVLIDFWATWCGPCVAGIPHLNELYAKHKDDGLVVLGFTDQSKKGIEEFLKARTVDYPMGTGSTLGAEFGVTRIPHAFLIGRDGKIAWQGTPADEEFEAAIDDALNAEPASSEVEAPEAASASTPTAGEAFYLDFPKLGHTWRDKPARAGVYLPTDYTSDKKFPLFVWFGGGAGTDDPKKPIAITEGEGFICVALPYRTEAGDDLGGWQTPWSYYETMLTEIEKAVPNVDPQRRVCGGFSSGGAAVMYQIGNSDGAFQEHFYAFVPGGAGWPMGGLDTIKGRPMLAVMGENDKRLPNFKALEQAALEAGVDFELRLFENQGHGFPEEFHGEVREWIIENVVERDEKSANVE